MNIFVIYYQLSHQISNSIFYSNNPQEIMKMFWMKKPNKRLTQLITPMELIRFLSRRPWWNKYSLSIPPSHKLLKPSSEKNESQLCLFYLFYLKKKFFIFHFFWKSLPNKTKAVIRISVDRFSVIYILNKSSEQRTNNERTINRNNTN